MTAYIVFALTTLACLALVAWSPQRDSASEGAKYYLLILLGGLLLVFSLRWLVRLSGHAELTIGDGLLFVVFGAGTALGAASRFRPYWIIASRWPLFSPMPERLRQAVLTVAGLAILALGSHDVSEGRRALLDCRSRLASATGSHARVLTLQRVPSATLRAYSGARPYTCGQLLDEQ